MARARGQRCAALLALAVTAVAALTLGAPSASAAPPVRTAAAAASATARPSAAATAANASRPPTSQRVCDAPAPGHVSCFALRRTDLPAAGAAADAGSPRVQGFGPVDLQSAYDLPSAVAGDGQTVAVVDAFDAPTAEQDLAVYRTEFGLPPCTTANGCFRKVDERGGGRLPAPDAGWAAEIALDLDMVSAVCPRCHLLLVEGDTSTTASLGTAVNTAVALGAKFVSNSYGGSEHAGQLDEDERYFHHPGVAITVSTGDSGYGVSYPSASRYVTAVGGTSLQRTSGDRGWAETAWSGAGSGCSQFEPRPAFQPGDLCSTRSVADVSAVADPATGVAVYDSYDFHGWGTFGGTSASAPIVAGAYALAGPARTGDLPVTYPYGTSAALHDVVEGSNGTCAPAALCTAAPGYDGPTGLGTPDGVSAFGPPGPHGTIAGTVTDAGTHRPVGGVAVATGNRSVRTDLAGRFALILSPGSYDLALSAYGYLDRTVPGVAVRDGATSRPQLALTQGPHATVSGRVLDSGHSWPVYARVTVRDTPLPPVFSDPFTGRYQVSVPASARYTLDVVPEYAGYVPLTVRADVGRVGVTRDLTVRPEDSTCTAAGYAPANLGLSQTFDTGSRPAGWTVVDGTPLNTWRFDGPAALGNQTGGSGDYAEVSFGAATAQGPEDTALVSPPVDMSALDTPEVSWADHYKPYRSGVSVDYTVDAGAHWTTVWSLTGDESAPGPATLRVPLPQAAHARAVQVRFHFTGAAIPDVWQVDDVFVGQYRCRPTGQGLVAGLVTDRNTGAGVANALVQEVGAPVQATSLATAEDPALGDGFYWLVTAPGRHALTSSRTGYTSTTSHLTVPVDGAVRVDASLAAPRVTARATPGDVTQPLGSTRSTQVSVTNTGTASAQVQVGEQAGAGSVLTGAAAPLQRVPSAVSPHRVALRPAGLLAAASTPFRASGTGAWTTLPDVPSPVFDNVVASSGTGVVSVGGTDGVSILRTGFSYDPLFRRWSPIARMGTPREKPAGAFVGGRLYVTGGWTPSGAPTAGTEAYDPATDTWTPRADAPAPSAAAGTAVLGGRLYVVGGCDALTCGSRSVRVYDPARDRWGVVADYPEAVSWVGCGAINGRVYCSGGVDEVGVSARSYVYDPPTGAWSRVADLPVQLYGAATAVQDDRLLVSTGVVQIGDVLSVTNEGFAYDPGADRWTALPNAALPVFRAGGACGFYRVGGAVLSGGFAVGQQQAQVLPGAGSCSGTGDVSWIDGHPRVVDVPAGGTVSFAVTTDARAVTQPGSYAGALVLRSSAPYPIAPVVLTMHVTPPPSWGNVTGTVSGEHCRVVTPLEGATVQVTAAGRSWTLHTAGDGSFSLWLPAPPGPVQLIATKDGWQPRSSSLAVVRGGSTLADLVLPAVRNC